MYNHTLQLYRYLERHHEVPCVLRLVRGQVLKDLGERAKELEHTFLEGGPILLFRTGPDRARVVEGGGQGGDVDV